MNTETQNLRKIMETLDSIDSTSEGTDILDLNEMDFSNSEHISGMLRSFSKVITQKPSDMAASYMIEAADLIDQLLYLHKNR